MLGAFAAFGGLFWILGDWEGALDSRTDNVTFGTVTMVGNYIGPKSQYPMVKVELADRTAHHVRIETYHLPSCTKGAPIALQISGQLVRVAPQGCTFVEKPRR